MARYETDICSGCGREIVARYMDGGLCPDCQTEPTVCEGCGRKFKLRDLEQTRDGWLCDTCMYGYKRVSAVCK